MPTTCANTRRNWSCSRLTSSWHLAPQPWRHYCRRRARSQSCLFRSPIRSVPGSSIAWRGPAATPLVSLSSSIGKWLELLKEIAPAVTRAAVVRDPAQTAGTGQFGAIQSVAQSVGMEVNPINMSSAGEIERALVAFARSPNGGLIVTASALSVVYRDLIITVAARHKLPAVYYRRLYVTSGGLISYGPDLVDQQRRAAGYVNRILNGEKPADLPVQAPTKYELVINLKTAKAFGLEVPASVLARAAPRVHHAVRRCGGGV